MLCALKILENLVLGCHQRLLVSLPWTLNYEFRGICLFPIDCVRRGLNLVSKPRSVSDKGIRFSFVFSLGFMQEVEFGPSVKGP
jgi:hypothetical protein